MLKTIKTEHEWLLRAASEYQFDGIISDNRYGMYHPNIPSIIMTHQVVAQSGLGDMVDALLRGIHYQRLQRFGACWVVDVQGVPNLAGKLAHPDVLPDNAKYIGLLSQIEHAATSEKHLLVLLSGPEPQRTMLADKLWEQVQGYDGKVVFVEGSEQVTYKGLIPAHITYHKRITKEVLTPLIADASLVICRSGYSTLMDLTVLGKKAILIPTPGQTEQEFLGKHLHKEGMYYCAAQKNFSLHQALKDVKNFPFHQPTMQNPHGLYKAVVDEWLASL
ncbi:hypothetical protein CAP35_05545 [Chitinophagaceae bacterium IBVUCB1]|nr:hypothetical protein CAP35_05545 [Chitinophagaceae bacterium IBVUCB1]